LLLHARSLFHQFFHQFSNARHKFVKN